MTKTALGKSAGASSGGGARLSGSKPAASRTSSSSAAAGSAGAGGAGAGAAGPAAVTDGADSDPAIAAAILAGTGSRPQSGTHHHHRHASQDFEHEHQHLNANTMSLQLKIQQLEKDLERRQESYITRERAYKVRIDDLEEELAAQREAKTGWMKADTKVGKLKQMHNQILQNVELVQDRTARILQEQESDLLRAFRARLFDVQSELEKERSKKDDGAAAWIERSRQLEAEVEWAKEVSDRLERVNQTLLTENTRLKSQFNSQEEDRNFLIKQLVSVKKDNARLRAEYEELEKENDNMKFEIHQLKEELRDVGQGAPSSKPGVAASANNLAQQKAESEERLREINSRLRRNLAEERRSLQQVRQNYANEMKVRTDMEMLLRQCVEDVRKEIARRYVEEGQFTNNAQGSDLAKLYSKNPGAIPVDDFSQGDRERVLELLLSQERVVSLIYAKTFPVVSNPVSQNNNINNSFSSNNHANAHSNEMDMSQLLDGNVGDLPLSPNSGAGAGADGRPVSSGMVGKGSLPPIGQRGMSR